MYIWIAAFAYDEISDMTDAGIVMYQMDFWNMWNMAIIGTGIAFVIASELCANLNTTMHLWMPSPHKSFRC